MLIVTSNRIDDNNNDAIFNVYFNYIMIKSEYVNIIWIFIFFLMNYVAYFTESRLSFFKITWCPTLSNSIKQGSKCCNWFFTNGIRKYYIQRLLCQTKRFLITGIKYAIPYYTDSTIKMY